MGAMPRLRLGEAGGAGLMRKKAAMAIAEATAITAAIHAHRRLEEVRGAASCAEIVGSGWESGASASADEEAAEESTAGAVSGTGGSGKSEVSVKTGELISDGLSGRAVRGTIVT